MLAKLILLGVWCCNEDDEVFTLYFNRALFGTMDILISTVYIFSSVNIQWSCLLHWLILILIQTCCGYRHLCAHGRTEQTRAIFLGFHLRYSSGPWIYVLSLLAVFFLQCISNDSAYVYNALIYLFSDPAGLRATYLWSCSEFSWTPYARIWREMYLNWAKCKRVVHLISGKIEIDRLFDHWAVLSLIN
jgi:hypothetical protein